MKKRMLSLLLALVMTLSLCVPALAADEFEAETVTEVEEQAPEAPAEPEAPEAEVVEAPAVEEPVEAPAAAAAVAEEAEDVPMLVALGVISKTVHYELANLIEAAEKLSADVAAGKLRAGETKTTLTIGGKGVDLDKYAEDPEANDPFDGADGGFAEKLATAKEYLAAIEGKEVEYDVTDSTVQKNAIKPLKALVETDDTKLTADAHEDMGKDTLTTALGIDNIAKTLNSKHSQTIKDTLQFDGEDDVTTGAWAKGYHTDYLTKLQKAVDLVAEYKDGESTFADYKAAAYAILDALVLEASSTQAKTGDKAAFDDAVRKLQAVDEEDYGDYAVNNGIKTAIGKINDLVDGNTLTGFAKEKDYYDIQDFIEEANAALVKKSVTIQYDSHKIDQDKKNVTVTVSVAKVNGTQKNDGNTYGYAYKIGKLWYDLSQKESGAESGAEEFNVKFITDVGETNTEDAENGRWTGEVKLANFGKTASVTAFTDSDEVTIYFFKKGASDYSAVKSEKDAVASKTFKPVYSNGGKYDGPYLKSAELAVPTSVPEISVSDGIVLVGGSQTPTLSSYEDTAYAELSVTLDGEIKTPTDYSGKNKITMAIGGTDIKLTDAKVSDGKGADSIKMDKDGDKALKAGTATVKFEVAMAESPQDGDYIARGTATVTVEALSKWSQAENIGKILEAAGKLVPGDYTLNDSSKLRPGVSTVADAFKDIQNQIDAVNKLLNDATLANSAANRTAVVNAVKVLYAACDQLKKGDVDTEALETVIDEAQKALAKDGKDGVNYDYKTYGALSALVDESNGKYTTGTWTAASVATNETQSEVDAAVAEIQAALDALTGTKPADKAALEKAVADAKALKEDDYTEESWAAAKTEIDTAVKNAEAVIANEKATDAEIDAALAALNTATGKLVKKGDEPVEPTVPPVPEKNGRVWEKAEDGTWYCYIDKKLQKSTWIYSKGGLWYYVDKDGKMLEGFQYIEGKWYMLQDNDNGGTRGTIVTSKDGWIYDDAIPGGCAYAINKRNTGHFGEITWTQAGGDFVNGHFEKGDPAV